VRKGGSPTHATQVAPPARKGRGGKKLLPRERRKEEGSFRGWRGKGKATGQHKALRRETRKKGTHRGISLPEKQGNKGPSGEKGAGQKERKRGPCRQRNGVGRSIRAPLKEKPA